MGRNRGRRESGGRPVEPEEARAHGNDPDAVEIREGEWDDREATQSRTEGSSRGSSTRGGGNSSDAGRRRDEDDEGGRYAPTRRDSVRWGPIWAGLITALTTFLLLQLLALGIGIMGLGSNTTGGAWVSAIIGLIAFFTGGAVAGMTSAIRGTGSGLLNGFMVWALGTVLILLLSALGLGSLLGTLGNVVGQIIGQINPASLGGVSAPDVSPDQAAQAVRNGALGAFFGLLLSALASVLGGWLGGRTRQPVGHPTELRRS